VCTDVRHPILPRLRDWCEHHSEQHDVELVQKKMDLTGGDILFLVSCQELIEAAVRAQYRAVLVLHASDLPEGRGMSPHIWQVLEGCDRIKVTLLAAEEALDSGDIWLQREFCLDGHELYDEINDKLFDAELVLMDEAVAHFDEIEPRPQDSRPPTWYRFRTPADSRLLPEKAINEQFNLLRVSDPNRFPAYFDWQGYRYEIRIKKSGRSPQ
jgi:methionyl-tRNA formyltransferase